MTVQEQFSCSIDEESSCASHKEVTTQTEKRITTERKDSARPARKPRNRAKARNNTLRRNEEGRSTGVDQKQTQSPFSVILKTYHSSTCCPQRMLETHEFPQTTLTEERWLLTCNPSTLRSSKLSVMHVCRTPLSCRID